MPLSVLQINNFLLLEQLVLSSARNKSEKKIIAFLNRYNNQFINFKLSSNLKSDLSRYLFRLF